MSGRRAGAEVAPRPAAPAKLPPAVGEPIPPPEPQLEPDAELDPDALPALPAPVLYDVLEAPIEHAYALVPDPARPGRFFAVHLQGVVAASFDHLEPSGRSDLIPRGMLRIDQAMSARHRARRW